MKYTSDYINSLSFQEYIKLMATELNSNGFKKYDGYEYPTFEDDPVMRRLFMMGPIKDPKAMIFLKEKGLIDNGRCPSCGAPMSVYKYTWSDRRDPSKKYYLCYGCYKNHGKGDGHSMDGYHSGAPTPSNSESGCIISLLLMPVYIVKSFIINYL